ncbi:hypothetical protein Tco_0894566 [Tanacetum coccineum]|uniref:Uncharacterized protein n=1 Tax=Tanacetum coccineum TaxID=301880 RepID=A0ABQ5CIE8_9ASTR
MATCRCTLNTPDFVSVNFHWLGILLGPISIHVELQKRVVMLSFGLIQSFIMAGRFSVAIARTATFCQLIVFTSFDWIANPNVDTYLCSLESLEVAGLPCNWWLWVMGSSKGRQYGWTLGMAQGSSDISGLSFVWGVLKVHDTPRCLAFQLDVMVLAWVIGCVGSSINMACGMVVMGWETVEYVWDVLVEWRLKRLVEDVDD